MGFTTSAACRWHLIVAWFLFSIHHFRVGAKVIGTPSLIDIFSPPPGANSTTKLVLDALAKAPPGFLPSFRNLPRNVWECIFDCFADESTDALNLLQVSDASYEGFLELARTDNTWADGSFLNFLEDDPQSVAIGGAVITIAEPCNTISNVAFYRSMFALCDRSNRGLDWNMQREEVRGLVRGLNLLAFGSTFYHASITKVGNRIDNLGIQIIAFIGHQALVNALGDNPDPVLFNLARNSTRAFTGVLAAEELSRILLMDDPNTWLNSSNSIDIPDYPSSFAGIVALLFTATLPAGLDTLAINLLTDVLIVKEEDRQTIAEFVVPAVKEALKNVQVPLADRIKLLPRLAGVLLKTVSLLLDLVDHS